MKKSAEQGQNEQFTCQATSTKIVVSRGEGHLFRRTGPSFSFLPYSPILSPPISSTSPFSTLFTQVKNPGLILAPPTLNSISSSLPRRSANNLCTLLLSHSLFYRVFIVQVTTFHPGRLRSRSGTVVFSLWSSALLSDRSTSSSLGPVFMDSLISSSSNIFPKAIIVPFHFRFSAWSLCARDIIPRT